jgi:hypothetical protein
MTTRETDRGEEPMIDEDKWVQYCFTNWDAALGEEMLFIEFVFDYNQWGWEPPTKPAVMLLKLRLLPLGVENNN